MSIPKIYFDPWNTSPCLPDGRLIDQDTIGGWDQVTHRFMDDWGCKLILDDNEGYNITIKASFISDGGSIPKIFHNIINPWGVYAPGFFIHDVLYATEHFDRAKCDWLLLCSCQALGACWVRRNEIYSAVRLCGGFVWDKHLPLVVESNKKLLVIESL